MAFYDCPKRYLDNIEFRIERFLFGFKKESLILNLLILIAKNYIYKCKQNACRANNVLSANVLMDNLTAAFGRETIADFPMLISQFPRRDCPRNRADLA